MDSHAVSQGRRAGARNAGQALDKVDLVTRRWQVKGIPAQLVGHGVAVMSKVLCQEIVVNLLVRRVHDRRADAIEPAVLVLKARLGKRRARELLGVQVVRANLWAAVWCVSDQSRPKKKKKKREKKQTWGEFWPFGNALGSASEHCSVPKPLWYLYL